MTTAYERSYDYSEDVIERVRHRLNETRTSNCVVTTCGSYARREASEISDLDYLIFSENENEAKALRDNMDSIISQVGVRSPAAGEPFDRWTSPNSTLENIDGEEDLNSGITRRILLLLEGEWLLNKTEFHALRRKVLERYIPDTIGREHLAMFLLNDVVRYYRTVAVDYEFKTSGSAATKPWTTRLLKLLFSRKFLYGAGYSASPRRMGKNDKTRSIS